MPTSFADIAFTVTSLVVVVLLFVGNVLLGVTIWRFETLPKWAGALWAGGAVLMYTLGLVYAATIGSQSTPPTVLVGTSLLVIGGGGMAWSVLRTPSTQIGVERQPRVQ